jgi:Ca2+-binding EF-hand superfamily protein
MNDNEQPTQELKESFDYNDSNRDGKISLEEFKTMLDELEAYIGDGEARIGFAAIDSDRDGAIDFDEFLAWWTER